MNGQFQDQAEPPFSIEIRESDAYHLLALTGQIGLEAAPLLHTTAQRLATGGADVRMDWAGAGHVSAAALQVLLALGSRLAADGRGFSVSADAPGVRRFLEISGLSDRFPCDTGAGA
jgi:anti-anti-sigma factor